MSSMTIDQLKKSLTEQGITLPPSRSKKADYVKLYNSTINDSLGDVYASDDENPPKSGSQNVTSTSSPSKVDFIAREVEQLSDDDLYHKLKEFDDKIGPVLKNTRRVYEKKLIKMLSSGKQSNGFEGVKSQREKPSFSVDELSDSDAEIVTQSAKKAETKSRKSFAMRESPKSSLPEPSFKPDFEKSYSKGYDYSNRSSTPSYSNEIKPSKFSYIETIPKGSTHSYIEADSDIFGSSDLRQRFTDRYNADKFNSDIFNVDKYPKSRPFDGNDEFENDDTRNKPSIGFKDQYKPSFGTQFKSGLRGEDYFKTNLESGDQFKSVGGTNRSYKPNLGITNQYKTGGFGEHYTGTWEPNINRYLDTGAQKKNISNKTYNFSSWYKKILAALLLLAILAALIYIYQHWSTNDFYKTIEDDADRTLEALSEGSGN